MRADKALKYFLLTKYQAEIFSKDPSTKVGALILAPDSYEILSLGYNGMPRKIDETKPERWQRPIKYMFVEHAERNAIYNATRKGVSLDGAIALVTMFPCADCARGLIQVGISMLVCTKPTKELIDRWGAHFDVSTEMLQEAEVSILYVEDLFLEMESNNSAETAGGEQLILY